MIKNMTTKSNLKQPLLVVSLIMAAFLLSACTISTNSSKNTGIDSSVFLSTDSGNSWRQAVSMASPGEDKSISAVEVNLMSFDPQDNLAVYLATFNNGLYYTYNIVQDGWVKVKNLPAATINDVKVDPKNKCMIYAAIGNRLYQSVDCARTWNQVYYDNNTEVGINTIAVDHYNSKNVYIGTSRGEIIKSIDAGAAWRTIQRLDKEGISQIIISPLDSRLIFVASSKNRIFSFNSNSNTDAATSEDIERNFIVDNWTDLNTVLKDYDLGKNFRDFVVCEADGKMFIATNQVILRSPDTGITWEKIKILQPEKDAVINALAVDPKNSNNIYYVTNTTFFRSTDAGTTWITKKLPTNRGGRELLIDFNDPRVIYLGTKRLDK